MTNRRKITALPLMLLALNVGCSKMHSNASAISSHEQNLSSPSAPNNSTIPSTPRGAPRVLFPKVSLCSGLDFNGVTWPSTLSSGEQNALALALNISSGFEGSGGWATLTNSFDGQGLSMGLLNQNLGQGTLEPMWIDMHSSNAVEMRRSFSSGNLQSLMSMLSDWKGIVIPATINLADYGYSSLDDLALVAADLGVEQSELEDIQTALISRNQVAVDWARSTLYRGRAFKSDWSTQLKALAVTPTYRSLQISQAEKIHRAALEMLNTFKMHELRSYIFFFDINVQNGGLSLTVRQDFNAWLKSNRAASEPEKLKQILALRLRSVSRRFTKDVFLRKIALIKGVGVVHGQPYNFEKEFCVALSSRIIP